MGKENELVIGPVQNRPLWGGASGRFVWEFESSDGRGSQVEGGQAEK